MHSDWLGTARRLAKASPKRPRQSDLRRAVSGAYYALFHALAKDGADLLVGVGQGRSDKAWSHMYRSFDHGTAKSGCGGVRNLGFPVGLIGCADAFVELQEARHRSDYDPNYRLTRAEALTYISQAEQAIAALLAASRPDRRAFAVQLRFKKR